MASGKAIRFAPLAFALLAGSLILLSLHCSRPKRPNVLWITLDSCRYDHLGCYGYSRAKTPNIDAIADQGTAFTQAIAQASATRHSVPSMVTGRYPLYAQARDFAMKPQDDLATLAEILGGEEYRSMAIAKEPQVVSSTRGFEEVVKSAGSTAQRSRACLRALEKFQGDPFFIWLYYWDPHLPYQPPDRFLKLFEPTPLEQPDPPQVKPPEKAMRHVPVRDEDGLLKAEIAVMGRINFQGDVTPTELDKQHFINLYDAEIAFVDDEIGRITTRLKQLGLYDNTVILITADHGEAFGEHDKYYHGFNLFDEVVRVPLVVKPPHSRPEIRSIATPVRNVDIMPTILDYCRAPIPKDIEGVSLRPFMEGKNTPSFPAYMEIFYQERGSIDHLMMGFRTETHKLIYDMIQGDKLLFDLQADPGEHRNLLSSGTSEITDQTAKSLEGRVREAMLSHLGLESLDELAQMKLTEKMDRETQERLRALGYIE